MIGNLFHYSTNELGTVRRVLPKKICRAQLWTKFYLFRRISAFSLSIDTLVSLTGKPPSVPIRLSFEKAAGNNNFNLTWYVFAFETRFKMPAKRAGIICWISSRFGLACRTHSIKSNIRRRRTASKTPQAPVTPPGESEAHGSRNRPDKER